MSSSEPLHKRFIKLRWLAWLLVPILFAWILQRVPLSEAWSALSRLGTFSIATLILVNVFILFLFNSRWWLILRAQGQPVAIISLIGYRLAGFSVSYLTPGTQFGGEPLQVYLLQSRHRVPAALAAASVTLDKLFEVLANFTFLVVGLVLVLNGGLLRGIANPRVLILVVAMLFLPLTYLGMLSAGRFPLAFLVARLPARLTSAKRIAGWLPFTVSTERQVASLCHHQPLLILGIVLLSGLMWALVIFEYWLTLHFLGLSLSPLYTIAALTAARLAFLAPLPGGLGALEASQMLAFGAIGVSPALGLSASLLIRSRDIFLAATGLWLGAFLARQARR